MKDWNWKVWVGLGITLAAAIFDYINKMNGTEYHIPEVVWAAATALGITANPYKKVH